LWSDKHNKYLVKRVIATEGQTIDIDNETGNVYVDGVLQFEPYIAAPTSSKSADIVYPYIVPDNHTFVMGDNRTKSSDSRDIGVIENSDIVGKAMFRIWPFDSIGGLYDNVE